MAHDIVLLPGERLLVPLFDAVRLMHRVLGTQSCEDWEEAASGTGAEVTCAFLSRMAAVFLRDGRPPRGLVVPDSTTGVVPFRCLDDPDVMSDAIQALDDHACAELLWSDGSVVATCRCGQKFSSDEDFEYHRFTAVSAVGVVFGTSAKLVRDAEQLARIGSALKRSQFFAEHETARLSVTSSGLAHLLSAVHQDKRSF